ncbi:acyltransferase family protein [Methylophilus sp. 14]|uniref:acyltransferase family protein n=1 Tax=Methylophilus sp. 14 TaxID=2781019 RepID=UPI00189051A8|nr:acyltransferase family protein [Methylophilus sp. 14]MBF4988579.1 acyltransferase [Methylophilus sp. 14]
MNYRADLDGIRALAIIPVLIFHAELPFLPQGYLGVDIFFVLSGFLISSYLLDEIQANGQVSFSSFYERRVRRIFPALFFMMLVVTFASMLLLAPRDLVEYCKSQISALFSVSNIYFWQQSSYFDTSNNLKPLLHTWSLSVEEQFYLFFPWLLFFLRFKNNKTKLKTIFLLIFLSLAFAQTLSFIKPVASFYLLPTRAFELLLGVSATLALTMPSVTNRVLGMTQYAINMLSVSAVLLIVILMAIPVEAVSLPSPGLYSFAISFLVSLLCVSGIRESLTTRVLSLKPIIFIGLLSYSLYLWHQPIFALARYISPLQLTSINYLLLIVLTSICSYLSWKFVETPFRNRKKVPQSFIWIFAAISTLLILLVSGYIYQTQGMPTRFSKENLRLMSMSYDGRKKAEVCSASKDKQFELKRMCVLGSSSNINSPSYILFGDSHASAISPAISDALNKRNLKAYQATYLGCPPGIGVERVDNNFSCNTFNDQVLKFILESPSIKNVIISARWTLQVNQSEFNNGEGGVEAPERPQYKTLSGLTPIDTSVQLINYLLNHNKNVILVYPIPEVGLNVPMTLYRLNHDISTDYMQFQARTIDIYRKFDLLTNERLFKIYPSKKLCPASGTRCLASMDNHPLYYDDDHLSPLGAKLALEELDQALEKIEGL